MAVREAGGDAQPNMSGAVALVFSSAIALNQSCLDTAGRLGMCDMRAVYMALMAARRRSSWCVCCSPRDSKAPAIQPRPPLL